MAPWCTPNLPDGQHDSPKVRRRISGPAEQARQTRQLPDGIEEVASVYKDDIDVSELSTQLEIFGTSFSEPKATFHEVIKCLQSLSASQP